MEHLHPKAAEFLALGDEERIARIQTPITIVYPLAVKILGKLESLFSYPRVARPRSMLVCGDSNAGKTALVSHFVEKKNAALPEEPTLPILMVQSPPTPNDRDLYSICMERLEAPFKAGEPAFRLRAQLGVILRELHTRMIVIDEVHNLLGGSIAKQRAFLATLKFLSNDLRLPIVAVGTRDALLAFQIETQIANRFEPVALPRWRDDINYRRLLASFERSLPLRKPSGLSGDALAARLLTMSEGLLGEIATILILAGEAAVRSGRECVDKETLDELEWVLPSQRRAEAVRKLAHAHDDPFSDPTRSHADGAASGQSTSAA